MPPATRLSFNGVYKLIAIHNKVNAIAKGIMLFLWKFIYAIECIVDGEVLASAASDHVEKPLTNERFLLFWNKEHLTKLR